MTYKLGRFLQLVGLLVVPTGIAGNLARPESIDLKMSLTIAGIGMLVFSLGWLMQQSNKPQ